MATCFSASGKLLICGNGGSAADSKHIVAELMKGFRLRRRLDDSLVCAFREASLEHGDFLAGRLQAGLPAISLASEESLLTAVANDVEPALVFAQQIMALGRAGDVLLAISTSGNSTNVLYAVLAARAKRITTVLLSGQDGGNLRKHCDIAVLVPETETHLIQELHLPVYHALCLALEEEFFGERP
ncbi:MAG: SIS domain-containing protein [Desulfovibrio sp.]|nr:SIS domain-containing protein [Desulfovibrio sp.]